MIKNKFEDIKVSSQEISKERFLEIMLEYAYHFSENPERFGLDYISGTMGIPKKDFKPKRLDFGDKYLIKRSCMEYLEDYVREGRYLCTHNAKSSGLRVVLFDRTYYGYE